MGCCSPPALHTHLVAAGQLSEGAGEGEGAGHAATSHTHREHQNPLGPEPVPDAHELLPGHHPHPFAAAHMAHLHKSSPTAGVATQWPAQENLGATLVEGEECASVVVWWVERGRGRGAKGRGGGEEREDGASRLHITYVANPVVHTSAEGEGEGDSPAGRADPTRVVVVMASYMVTVDSDLGHGGGVQGGHTKRGRDKKKPRSKADARWQGDINYQHTKEGAGN